MLPPIQDIKEEMRPIMAKPFDDSRIKLRNYYQKRNHTKIVSPSI